VQSLPAWWHAWQISLFWSRTHLQRRFLLTESANENHKCQEGAGDLGMLPTFLHRSQLCWARFLNSSGIRRRFEPGSGILGRRQSSADPGASSRGPKFETVATGNPSYQLQLRKSKGNGSGGERRREVCIPGDLRWKATRLYDSAVGEMRGVGDGDRAGRRRFAGEHVIWRGTFGWGGVERGGGEAGWRV
jgi:hypothetical protein